MDCRFTIYCHTNRVNGKRYVGQTVYSMEKRWRDHVSSSKFAGRRSLFANAVRKYGADAFEHQILEVVSTQDEANLAESRWIEQFACSVPRGYNLTLGGGAAGRLHENTKRLIGKASRAKWQKMTPERRGAIKRAMSEAARTRWEDDHDNKHRAAKRLQTWWQKMPPEERFARQVARQKTVAPERRKATIVKSWETRREKYGEKGVRRVKSFEEHGATIKKGWARMAPDARAERVRKIKEGVRKAREARSSRMIRINLIGANP